MMYTVDDVAGLLLAVSACTVLLYLPGLAIGRISGALGSRNLPPNDAFLVAAVLGTAILPAIDNLVATGFGLGTALALNLVLAAFGLGVQYTLGWPRPGRLTLAAAGIWLAVVALSFVDLDWNGGLFSSLVKVDAVKHAATVRALADSGTVPPADPFFLRAAPAGYYYFYYIMSALAEQLCGGLIDQRAAFAGQSFWTGIALYGLVDLLLARSGLIRTLPAGTPRGALVLALLTVGGVQILPVVRQAVADGSWLAQVNWWGDQVTSFPISLIWVPHHVAALIAVWTGLLVLARLVHLAESGERQMAMLMPLSILAALAFASAAGLSIWVAFAGALAISLWLAGFAAERRWEAITAVIATGLFSVAVDLPYLTDLVSFRAYSGAPVAFELRPFPFTDGLFEPGAMQTAARIAGLPIDFFVEFGILLIGAVLFWRNRQALAVDREEREVGRLLIATAIAGLFIASCLRSTIGNNDLGWRAVLFAQMAFLVWTISALAQLAPSARMPVKLAFQRAPAIVVIMLVLGYLSIAYDLVGMRAYNPLGLLVYDSIRSDARLDREVRTAYTWLADNVDQRVVVQHNPDTERAFGFGLYGRNRVAVSDHLNGYLFGAAKADVEARVGEIAEAFAGRIADDEALQRLRRNHVGAVVVTSEDGVWKDQSSWVWTLPVMFASTNVRIVAVGAAAGQAHASALP